MAKEKKDVGEKLSSIITLLLLSIFLLLILSIVRTSIFGYVEEEKHIYFEIVFLLLLAVFAEMIVFYLKQQNVIVLLILGIVMSASFMTMVWSFLLSLNLPLALPQQPPTIIRDEGIINVFAQLGAIILLFKVGLHSKVERIFSKENTFVASAGVILPFVCGYFYASLTDGNFAYSMFVGAALTATSVGITVAMLKEMGLLTKRFAEVIIGAAVIDDVLGLLVLSLVINLTSAGAGSEQALVSVGMTFITVFVFMAGAVAASRYFIEYYDRKEMSARRFLIAMAFMLFFAYVAEVIGLSAIVGAFLSGVILNRSRHLSVLEEKTYGLELLFMPIFFISLGMLMDINALGSFFVPILVITAIAIATKLIGCGAAAVGVGLSPREAAIIGFGMAPRGEVALIIAAIGLSKGVLTVAEYTILSAMALLTAFLVPPILVRLLRMKE